MWLESPTPPRLYINDLSLTVGIGCTAKERANPQELRISLAIEFPGYPVGIQTDELADTTCYHKICDAISSHVMDHPYQLIEKLAHDLYHEVRKLLPSDALLQVIVHKVMPPINHLQGGVKYVCGDKIQ